MARFAFEMRTGAPPDAVRAALLDFSDRRPDLLPGLPRDQDEVYEVGDTWAEIREGYRGPIWNRERYDWSDPNVIKFTAVDSGFVKPGKRVVIRIEPGSGGGSTVLATWQGSGSGIFGTIFVGFMALTRGLFIRRSIQSGLDRIAGAGLAPRE